MAGNAGIDEVFTAGAAAAAAAGVPTATNPFSPCAAAAASWAPGTAVFGAPESAFGPVRGPMSAPARTEDSTHGLSSPQGSMGRAARRRTVDSPGEYGAVPPLPSPGGFNQGSPLPEGPPPGFTDMPAGGPGGGGAPNPLHGNGGGANPSVGPDMITQMLQQMAAQAAQHQSATTAILQQMSANSRDSAA